MRFWILISTFCIGEVVFAGAVCSREVYKKYYQQAQIEELQKISNLLSQKTSPAKLTAVLQDYEKTFREFPRLVNKNTKEKSTDSLAMVKDNGNWVVVRSDGSVYEVPHGNSQYTIQKRMTDPAFFHHKARSELKNIPADARREFGKAIFDLQNGEQLGMPLSKMLPSVGPGVSELRVKTRNGNYRVFYYTKKDSGIVIFHVFNKKTENLTPQEISVGRQRLKEMLGGNL